MTDKPCILVVDDDTRLRRLLRRYLTENGFRVSEAPTADDSEPLIACLQFDLIIMDMMMPGTTGIEMVQRLRENGNKTPILMLTAMGDVDHRISGLEAGSDDYLSKPFEPKELILRINNILRRTNQTTANRKVSFGNCLFDGKSGILTRDGQPVPLTGLETELLRFLASHAGQTVSRSDLMPLMDTDNDRTVDVQMTRLRKKIETDASHPVCIQTVRGQGYRLITQ
ncbi:MAG: response regulator transcription factor [Alphaproteobacteria bacterium]|nr:response regulator transcription factor [Alphaproteobacteria bacterium]